METYVNVEWRQCISLY